MCIRKVLQTNRFWGRPLTLFLAGILLITPVMEARAQTEATTGEMPVVVVDERVGQSFDLEERNRYGLFLFARDFQSAAIVQLPDGTYIAEITEVTNGEQCIRTLPFAQEELDQIRERISGFDELSPAVRDSISSLHQTILPLGGMPAINQFLIITDAQQQAKVLAQQEWSTERWREERLHDRGGSYRKAGAMLGCALGAAAGMLVGKGFQGKKVERTEHHSGGWGSNWTEEFYSYEHKYAPHWGAAIGGVGGAVLGHVLGKKADKEYYILVPRRIRVAETKSSGFGNFLFGFVVVGPIMGGIAGWSLHTPMSGRSGETDFGVQGLWGYLAGAILGTATIAAFKGRTKHRELSEESLLKEEGKPSASIQVIPLDSDTFGLNLKTFPSGETYCEYRMDLVRVRF